MTYQKSEVKNINDNNLEGNFKDNTQSKPNGENLEKSNTSLAIYLDSKLSDSSKSKNAAWHFAQYQIHRSKYPPGVRKDLDGVSDNLKKVGFVQELDEERFLLCSRCRSKVFSNDSFIKEPIYPEFPELPEVQQSPSTSKTRLVAGGFIDQVYRRIGSISLNLNQPTEQNSEEVSLDEPELGLDCKYRWQSDSKNSDQNSETTYICYKVSDNQNEACDSCGYSLYSVPSQENVTICVGGKRNKEPEVFFINLADKDESNYDPTLLQQNPKQKSSLSNRKQPYCEDLINKKHTRSTEVIVCGKGEGNSNKAVACSIYKKESKGTGPENTTRYTNCEDLKKATKHNTTTTERKSVCDKDAGSSYIDPYRYKKESRGTGPRNSSKHTYYEDLLKEKEDKYKPSREAIKTVCEKDVNSSGIKVPCGFCKKDPKAKDKQTSRHTYCEDLIKDKETKHKRSREGIKTVCEKDGSSSKTNCGFCKKYSKVNGTQKPTRHTYCKDLLKEKLKTRSTEKLVVCEKGEKSSDKTVPCGFCNKKSKTKEPKDSKERENRRSREGNKSVFEKDERNNSGKTGPCGFCKKKSKTNTEYSEDLIKEKYKTKEEEVCGKEIGSCSNRTVPCGFCNKKGNKTQKDLIKERKNSSTEKLKVIWNKYVDRRTTRTTPCVSCKKKHRTQRTNKQTERKNKHKRLKRPKNDIWNKKPINSKLSCNVGCKSTKRISKDFIECAESESNLGDECEIGLLSKRYFNEDSESNSSSCKYKASAIGNQSSSRRREPEQCQSGRTSKKPKRNYKRKLSKFFGRGKTYNDSETNTTVGQVKRLPYPNVPVNDNCARVNRYLEIPKSNSLERDFIPCKTCKPSFYSLRENISETSSRSTYSVSCDSINERIAKDIKCYCPTYSPCNKKPNNKSKNSYFEANLTKDQTDSLSGETLVKCVEYCSSDQFGKYKDKTKCKANKYAEEHTKNPTKYPCQPQKNCRKTQSDESIIVDISPIESDTIQNIHKNLCEIYSTAIKSKKKLQPHEKNIDASKKCPCANQDPCEKLIKTRTSESDSYLQKCSNESDLRSYKSLPNSSTESIPNAFCIIVGCPNNKQKGRDCPKQTLQKNDFKTTVPDKNESRSIDSFKTCPEKKEKSKSPCKDETSDNSSKIPVPCFKTLPLEQTKPNDPKIKKPKKAKNKIEKPTEAIESEEKSPKESQPTSETNVDPEAGKKKKCSLTSLMFWKKKPPEDEKTQNDSDPEPKKEKSPKESQPTSETNVDPEASKKKKCSLTSLMFWKKKPPEDEKTQNESDLEPKKENKTPDTTKPPEQTDSITFEEKEPFGTKLANFFKCKKKAVSTTSVPSTTTSMSSGKRQLLYDCSPWCAVFQKDTSKRNSRKFTDFKKDSKASITAMTSGKGFDDPEKGEKKCHDSCVNLPESFRNKKDFQETKNTTKADVTKKSKLKKTPPGSTGTSSQKSRRVSYSNTVPSDKDSKSKLDKSLSYTVTDRTKQKEKNKKGKSKSDIPQSEPSFETCEPCPEDNTTEDSSRSRKKSKFGSICSKISSTLHRSRSNSPETSAKKDKNNQQSSASEKEPEIFCSTKDTSISEAKTKFRNKSDKNLSCQKSLAPQEPEIDCSTKDTSISHAKTKFNSDKNLSCENSWVEEEPEIDCASKDTSISHTKTKFHYTSDKNLSCESSWVSEEVPEIACSTKDTSISQGKAKVHSTDENLSCQKSFVSEEPVCSTKETSISLAQAKVHNTSDVCLSCQKSWVSEEEPEIMCSTKETSISQAKGKVLFTIDKNISQQSFVSIDDPEFVCSTKQTSISQQRFQSSPKRMDQNLSCPPSCFSCKNTEPESYTSSEKSQSSESSQTKPKASCDTVVINLCCHQLCTTKDAPEIFAMENFIQKKYRPISPQSQAKPKVSFEKNPSSQLSKKTEPEIFAKKGSTPRSKPSSPLSEKPRVSFGSADKNLQLLSKTPEPDIFPRTISDPERPVSPKILQAKSRISCNTAEKSHKSSGSKKTDPESLSKKSTSRRSRPNSPKILQAKSKISWDTAEKSQQSNGSKRTDLEILPKTPTPQRFKPSSPKSLQEKSGYSWDTAEKSKQSRGSKTPDQEILSLPKTSNSPQRSRPESLKILQAKPGNCWDTAEKSLQSRGSKTPDPEILSLPKKPNSPQRSRPESLKILQGKSKISCDTVEKCQQSCCSKKLDPENLSLPKKPNSPLRCRSEQTKSKISCDTEKTFVKESFASSKQTEIPEKMQRCKEISLKISQETTKISEKSNKTFQKSLASEIFTKEIINPPRSRRESLKLPKTTPKMACDTQRSSVPSYVAPKKSPENFCPSKEPSNSQDRSGSKERTIRCRAESLNRSPTKPTNNTPKSYQQLYSRKTDIPCPIKEKLKTPPRSRRESFKLPTPKVSCDIASKKPSPQESCGSPKIPEKEQQKSKSDSPKLSKEKRRISCDVSTKCHIPSVNKSEKETIKEKTPQNSKPNTPKVSPKNLRTSRTKKQEPQISMDIIKNNLSLQVKSDTIESCNIELKSRDSKEPKKTCKEQHPPKENEMLEFNISFKNSDRKGENIFEKIKDEKGRKDTKTGQSRPPSQPIKLSSLEYCDCQPLSKSQSRNSIEYNTKYCRLNNCPAGVCPRINSASNLKKSDSNVWKSSFQRKQADNSTDPLYSRVERSVGSTCSLDGKETFGVSKYSPVDRSTLLKYLTTNIPKRTSTWEKIFSRNSEVSRKEELGLSGRNRGGSAASTSKEKTERSSRSGRRSTSATRKSLGSDNISTNRGNPEPEASRERDDLSICYKTPDTHTFKCDYEQQQLEIKKRQETGNVSCVSTTKSTFNINSVLSEMEEIVKELDYDK